MALKIMTYDGSTGRGEWEAFVNQHPDGSVFQMPWMYEAWQHTRKQRTIVYFAWDEGRLAGVMMVVRLWNGVFPVAALSKRQLIIGGPLVENNDLGILLALLEALIKHTGKNAVFTSIHNLRMGLSLKPVFEEAGFYYESHLSIVLDVSRGAESLWETLGSDRKDNISRLIHSDYTIRELEKPREMEAAWQIIRCTAGQKGLPLPHSSLMMAIRSSKEMKRHFAFRGLIVDNRLQAVVLVLTHNNRAWIWFEGDCLKLSHRWMYDGFIWRVITELQGQGYRYVNMGDGGRPGKDMTARKYKKSFGGMVKETGRYAYIHNRFYWKTGKLLFKWYKKIRRFIYYYYCRK